MLALKILKFASGRFMVRGRKKLKLLIFPKKIWFFRSFLFETSQCLWTLQTKQYSPIPFVNTSWMWPIYQESFSHVESRVVIKPGPEKVQSTLIEWKPPSDHMIYARFQRKVCNISFINIYVPVLCVDDHDQDKFYVEFQLLTTSLSRSEWLLLQEIGRCHRDELGNR